jgi:hypothetical protein
MLTHKMSGPKWAPALEKSRYCVADATSLIWDCGRQLCAHDRSSLLYLCLRPASHQWDLQFRTGDPHHPTHTRRFVVADRAIVNVSRPRHWKAGLGANIKELVQKMFGAREDAEGALPRNTVFTHLNDTYTAQLICPGEITMGN